MVIDIRNEIFDAIVIGSGASGGWACKQLAEAGLKIALIDAGPPQNDKNFTEHMPRFQLRYRNEARGIVLKTRPVQGTFYDCSEYNYTWYCNDLDEPYSSYGAQPFSWGGRLRIGGGRTNVWGRLSLRYSDLDFKGASFDGYGVDWPIGYKDIAPYYDIVERYVGVAGRAEGNPQIPDGIFQPDMGLMCSETLFIERVKTKLQRTVTPGRMANLTKPLNGRAACHYCGPCLRGCVTHSYFNSSFTTVPDALKTGNCTYIPNAMAYKVLMNPERNRAAGILFIDRNTRQPKEAKGRIVILCAQAFESARILLNSANQQYPNGLGNSSGVLGHYVMDHIAGAGASGDFPELQEKPNMSVPKRPAGIYIPRFRNLPNGPRSRDFLRGYGYEGGGNISFSFNAPGFGEIYKQGVLKGINRLSLRAFGEVLPYWDNFVEIDPTLVDAYGIPALRFHVTHRDNELALIRDSAKSAAEMLEAAGAKNVKTWLRPTGPGRIRHEVGVARMGENPKTSVLNQFQQSHDIKNLFVMDASAFPSNPCENPTLTIMALCVRSCDHLMAEMRRGNL
jgi:glucoside 3-dehydrogenase (cytochrome c) catalytic subunit